MYLEFKGSGNIKGSDIEPTRLCYGCEVICFMACTGCDGCLGCKHMCGKIAKYQYTEE